MTTERLVNHLRELGASESQLRGMDDSDLIGLAGDLRLAAGRDLTVDELAARVGCDVEYVRQVYWNLGLPVEDLCGFGPGDIELMSLVIGDSSGMIEDVGPQVLRVAGAAMARLAEAVVAAYVQDIETRNQQVTDPVDMATQNAFASSLAVALSEQLPTAFLHHMWTAVRRQRRTQEGVESPEIARMAVGFVDLVGFTSFANTTSAAKLLAAIDDFEHHASDTATRHGGRIVKSIGDEVMIAAGNAKSVAEIAVELIAVVGGDKSVSPRGGIAAGDVLFRMGDYYGPVVNLAARLVAEAVPGEVLCDDVTAHTAGVRAEAAGRRNLKGFDDPVAVWSIDSS